MPSPVLLLHGSGPGTTGAAWASLTAALEPRFEVLAPDLLGFGASAPPWATGGEVSSVPAGAASPRAARAPSSAPAEAPARSFRAAWTAQAATLVDALDAPCAVVGNSAGGAIALSLAHARPRAITKVVAIGSMGHPMALPDGLDALWGCDMDDPRAIVELVSPGPATPAAVEARRAAMDAQPHYPSLFPAPRQRWVDDLSLRADELAAIAQPVLLIHGTHDRIVPLRDGALALLDALPDARAHVFGGAGHATPLERTDEFNRLITSFLETHR